MNGCGTPPAVTFVYADWLAAYPAFANVSAGSAQASFNTATLYCSNKIGPVPNTCLLTQFLYLLTAHVAALNFNQDGTPKPFNSPVGRLSDATEGSVSASFENLYPPGSAQWYQQTQFGAEYWAATANYRNMHYRPGGRRFGRGGRPWQYPGSGNWAG